MKTLIRSIAILVLMYYVADKTWNAAMNTFAKKLVEKAEAHPEMTLAELLV